jgi:hypothetical protein
MFVQVVFQGTTTFGYEEWSGPLLSIAGANIVVTGASGHVINGDGARWWDGKGSNGGKTKPKFFYAHKLTGTSSITGLNIKNTPVQAVSINGASGLTIANMVIDNSAGDTDALGHNTDAFDVGESTNIVISGANVKNQDDCLAVNSGTVRISQISSHHKLIYDRVSPSRVERAQVATACLSAQLVAAMITQSQVSPFHPPPLKPPPTEFASRLSLVRRVVSVE